MPESRITERYYLFCVDGGADHAKNNVVQSKRGTGWCLLTCTDTTEPELLAFGHVLGGPNAWLDAITTRNSIDPAYTALRRATVLVVEDFKLINARAKIDPLEIVGMMKMWGACNRVNVVLRTPKSRLGVSHEDLKRIGMWPGGGGHADTAQAIRHGLSALMAKGHEPTMRLISPE